jgi:hypothetical protein
MGYINLPPNFFTYLMDTRKFWSIPTLQSAVSRDIIPQGPSRFIPFPGLKRRWTNELFSSFVFA